MAEIFKFFNSAPGDERWHYASDFADYFGSVLSSGLISNGDSPVGLQVTVNAGTMTTSVNVGRALIKGYSYENTTPLTLTHSIPEQTLDRIDRVVLRLDLKNASRFIRVFIKEGVSALEPVPPTLQRDQYIYELSLAQVRIRKNTSSIVVSDIKDERADESLCGIVQSLITVPTSVFQQQFDAWFASIADVTEQSVADWQIAQQQAFTMWFESIKGQLDGDVGAKLASELTTHKADNTAHGIGDKSMLKTTDKTTIVGAVNELFTSVSNGKNEVANAITQKGQVANGSDTFTQLATSISAINTGKKWASGLVDSWDGKVIINNLPFKPSYVFISRQMLNGTSSPSINDSISYHYMVDVLQGGYAFNSVSTSYNSNYYGVWSKNGVSWNENTSTLTLNSVPASVRNMNFLAIE